MENIEQVVWPQQTNDAQPKESLACTVHTMMLQACIPVYFTSYSIQKDLRQTLTLMEILLFNSDFVIPENFPSNLKEKLSQFHQSEDAPQLVQVQSKEEIFEIEENRVKKDNQYREQYNEKRGQNCIVLQLKLKKMKRGKAASTQQVPREEKEIIMDYKLQTIYFVTFDETKIIVEKYDSDHTQDKNDQTLSFYLNEKSIDNNQKTTNNFNQELFWFRESIPIQKILNDQGLKQHFIGAFNADYQPQQRIKTFNIVCEVEYDTIRLLNNIANGQDKPNPLEFKTRKPNLHAIDYQYQEEVKQGEEHQNQVVYQTLIAQKNASPRSYKLLIKIHQDQQDQSKRLQQKNLEKQSELQSQASTSPSTQFQLGALQVTSSQPMPGIPEIEYSESPTKSRDDSYLDKWESKQISEAPSFQFEQGSEMLVECSSQQLGSTNSMEVEPTKESKKFKEELTNQNQYLQLVTLQTVENIMSKENNKLGIIVYTEPQTQLESETKRIIPPGVNDTKCSFLPRLLNILLKEETMKKILIISPTQSYGDILLNELTLHGIVQHYVAKKSNSKIQQPISSLPYAANFFGKAIKYIFNRNTFQETVEDVSLMVISPKLIYEYLMRKVIRIDDFGLIIFQDLSQFNDKHHQWFAEDFYLDCEINLRPKIVSLFSQKPKAPQDWIDWLKEAQTSFTSKLIKLDLSTIDLIENQEMKQLLRQGQQSKIMYDFNANFVVPAHSLRPKKEWLRYSDYLQGKNTASLTLREAPYELRYQLEELGKLCMHDTCKQQITEGSKQRVEQSLLFDQKRRHNLMDLTSKKLGRGEIGYKCGQIILPHCVKSFLDDIDYEARGEVIKFSNKKDCEGHMCMDVLKQIIKMGLVDEHSHLKQDIAIQYINNRKLTEKIQQKVLSYEDYPKSFSKIFNGYIQNPFSVNETIFIHVAVNQHQIPYLFKDKTQGDSIEISRNIQFQTLGFVFPDDRFKNRDMSYEMQIDPQQRLAHMDYLQLTGRAKDQREAYLMTSHHSDIMPYSLNQIVLEVKIDPSYELLQAIKLFHVWSMHSVANLESCFIRHLLKGKYSFSKALFNKEIEHLFKVLPNSTKDFAQKYQSTQYKKQQYSEAHHFMAPIRGLLLSGSEKRIYEVNYELLQNLIGHIKMQIINFGNNQLVVPRGLELMQTQQIKTQLWQQSKGMKQIVEIIKADDDIWSQKSFDIISKQEQIAKFSRLNLSQYFLATQGYSIDRKINKNLYKFKKSVTFIDTSATKSAYAFQDAQIQKEIDNILIGQDKEFSQQLQQLNSKIQTQLTPGQLVETYPLNYEMFSILQGACSHFLKLNDFLRTEAFIIKQFSTIPSQTNPNTLTVLNFEPHFNSKGSTNLKDTLLRNLSLVGTSLTAPQSQMAINNERLKTYGDALVSLLYSVDIYLSRSEKDTEKDLDSLRKQFNTKQNLDLINLRHKIYEYMQVEAQSQQPVAINLEKDPPSKILESLCIRHHTIHKNVTPGALGDNKFNDKIKNSAKFNAKHNIFMLKTQEERIKKQTKKGMVGVSEFQKICEILNLILCKHIWLENFKLRYPKEFQLLEELKDREGSEMEQTMNQSQYSFRGGINQSQFDEEMSFSSGFSQSLQNLSPSQNNQSQSQSFSSPLTKSGKPDMRFKVNKEAAGLGKKKIDGTPDMRFACNKVGQYGHSIENYASLLISDYDLTLNDLQTFILEISLEKIQKAQQQKKLQKQFRESEECKESPSVSNTPKSTKLIKPLSKNEKSSTTGMSFQINNDQKLGEAVEGIIATVALTSGLQESYKVMQYLGIFNKNLEQLQEKAKIEQQMQDNAQDHQALSDKGWIQKVESIIDYKFKNPQLVQQAFQHQTYCAFIEKNEKIQIKNYNLLEFIGDSVMNFLVVDFYFKHSNRNDLSKIYGHDQIHKLKTELTNNNFIAIVMIELGLHEYIKKKERAVFNNDFQNFVKLIQKSILCDKNGQTLQTKQIFQQFFEQKIWLNDPQIQKQYPKQCAMYGSKDLQEVFMEPQCMKFLAEITENFRIAQSETEVYHLKIFADVLEALIGAIFIDTGCDLNQTRKVFMNFFKPYLYVYGNMETVQDHPKTKLIQYWNKFPYGKIHTFPIALNHTNQLEEESVTKINEMTQLENYSEQKGYIYKGFIGGIEVLNERFEFQVKNKVKQFYRSFLWFIKELTSELKIKYPSFQKDLEALNRMERMLPQSSEYIQLKSQLVHAQTHDQLHYEVINTIKQFREGWNQIKLGEHISFGKSQNIVRLGKFYGGSQDFLFKIEPNHIQKKVLKKEYEALKAIGKHQNIISYNRYGKKLINGTKCAYLALENIENKPSFIEYILSYQDAGTREMWTRFWFRQIVSALRYIHSAGYSHSDIQLDNIVLSKDLSLILCNFENAQENTSYGILNKESQNYYHAPEIGSSMQPYNGEKADVFALAVILYIIQMKSEPSGKVCDVKLSKKYRDFFEGKYNQFWPKQINVSQEFKDLFTLMYQENPTKRATLDQVWEHPWVQKAELPTPKQIESEIAHIQSIRAGKTNQWKVQMSQFIFRQNEEVYKGGNDSDEEINVEEKFKELKNENHQILPYKSECFEWTQFRVRVHGIYILLLIVEIINTTEVENMKFKAEISGNLKTLEADITQVQDEQVEKMITPIKGKVTIYTDQEVDDDSQCCWVVFKRLENDAIGFNQLFEAVFNHPQVREEVYEWES